MHEVNQRFEFPSTAAVPAKRWAKYNLWFYPLSLSISDTLSTPVAADCQKRNGFHLRRGVTNTVAAGSGISLFLQRNDGFISVAEFAHHFQILLLLLLSLSRHRCELPRFSLPCVGCIFFYHGEARLGSILNTTGYIIAQRNFKLSCVIHWRIILVHLD